MPVIDVTLPSGVLTDEQLTHLADQLTHSLIKYEGFEPTPRRLGTVRVTVHESSAASHIVGGALGLQNQAAFYEVFVTVPEGVLSDEAKNGLVGEVTQTLLEMEGASVTLENSLRVYCLIVEIPDGNWGAAGRILRRTDMAELAKALS